MFMSARRLRIVFAISVCTVASSASGQTPRPDLRGTWYENEVDDCPADSLFLNANGSGTIRLHANFEKRLNDVHFRWINNRVLFEFDTIKAKFDALFVEDHSETADTGDHLNGTFELVAEDGAHNEVCSFERE